MTIALVESTTAILRCRCDHFIADHIDYGPLPVGQHFVRIKCPFCGRRHWYDLATSRVVDHPTPPKT